jgi:hypothetical protein
LTRSPVARRLTIVLPLALALAALATLLWRPAPTLGQGARAACASPTTASGRACAARKHRAHVRSKAKRHHTRHAVAKNKKKAKHKPAATAPPAPASTQPQASCEDAGAPVRAADGSYSCVDGSEPACADGSEPKVSSGHPALVCPVVPSAGTEWSEAICEDGSSPLPASGGGFACEDGSEAECEDGSEAIPSTDSSMLVCLAPGTTGSSSAFSEDSADGVRARAAIAS